MYVYTYIHYTPQIYDNIRANFPRFHNRIDTGRTRKQFTFPRIFALRDTKRYMDREIHTKEEKTSQKQKEWANRRCYGVG